MSLSSAAAGIPVVSPIGLALATGLIGLTLILMTREQLPLRRSLAISAGRAMIQLIALGFVLEWFFKANHWGWVIGLLMVMLMVAAHAGWLRLKTLHYRNQLPLALFSSLLVSTAITVGWVTQVVLNVHPWYHPYSFIPLAGMMIGNSLNSSILALDRFNNDCQQNVRVIEAKLCLGASVEQATHQAKIHALTTALTPTINTMAISGIVSIPGITTGQLLGGQSPLPAVFYQVVVMFMLVTTVMITSVLLIRWARQQTLNDLGQWRSIDS